MRQRKHGDKGIKAEDIDIVVVCANVVCGSMFGVEFVVVTPELARGFCVGDAALQGLPRLGGDEPLRESRPLLEPPF